MASDSSTWTWRKQSTAQLPLGLSGHSLVAHNHTLLLFGGEDSTGKPHNTLFTLDTTDPTCTWQAAQTTGHPPCPREGHSAVLLPSRQAMLVFGGGDPRRRYNDVFVLDLAGGAMRWSEVRGKGEVPAARCRHSACVVVEEDEERVMVFGGTDFQNDAFKDVHVLDVSSGVWTVRALAGSVERVWHAAVVREVDERRQVVLLAGEDRDAYLHNDVLLIEQGKMVKVQPSIDSPALPDRYGHVAVALDAQHVAVVGGYGGEFAMLNDVFVFSFTRKLWKRVEFAGDEPQPRFGAAIEQIAPGQWLMVGGTSASLAKLDDAWVLSAAPLSEAWWSKKASAGKMWTCAVCTFGENPASAPQCSVCGSANPGAPPVAAPSSTWNCSMCTLENPAGVSQCQVCGSAYRG